MLRSPYISGDLGQSMREDVIIFFDRAKKFETASEHFFQRGDIRFGRISYRAVVTALFEIHSRKGGRLLSEDLQPIETF